jgi:hypothetical protein
LFALCNALFLQVEKLAVAQGISAIEDALDGDAELWDSIQQQQAVLAQQQAAEAQRKQQEAAAAAAELSQLEEQFVNEFEEFELEWYTAAAAAAEAAEAEQQRQQQQQAAAAAAVRQQQEQQRQQQEQRLRQQEEADLQLLRAFEEGDLEDLEELQSLLLQSSSSSSSSSSSISQPTGGHSAAGTAAAVPSSPNGGSSSSSKAAGKHAAKPPAAAAAFDPDALFEELLNELPSSGPEPWMNGQQQQQQRQQQQSGSKKGQKKQVSNTKTMHTKVGRFSGVVAVSQLQASRQKSNGVLCCMAQFGGSNVTRIFRLAALGVGAASAGNSMRSDPHWQFIQSTFHGTARWMNTEAQGVALTLWHLAV